MSVLNWSSTPADNDDADLANGIDWREGQLAATVNNSMRSVMTAIFKLVRDISGDLTTTGSANAYVLTTAQTITSYAEPLLLAFKANFTNTTAATIAVDGLSTKSLLRASGAALAAGDIKSGGAYLFAYSDAAGAFLGLNVGGETPTEAIVIACSDETTALTTGNGKVEFRMPFAFTVSDVRGSLTTAQSSGSIFTVDVNDSGTTILSTKLTIDNNEKTSTTAATPRVISDTALADDAIITIDIDQIGDGSAKGLKVTLIGNRT